MLLYNYTKSIRYIDCDGLLHTEVDLHDYIHDLRVIYMKKFLLDINFKRIFFFVMELNVCNDHFVNIILLLDTIRYKQSKNISHLSQLFARIISK